MYVASIVSCLLFFSASLSPVLTAPDDEMCFSTESNQERNIDVCCLIIHKNRASTVNRCDSRRI